jgi:hypothetical protein
LKRAALPGKALDALEDLVSGAQFIDQVSARLVSTAIGIRPEQVRRLIRAELSAARATLRRRRETSTFQVPQRASNGDASVMNEPFFFDSGAVDVAADTWDFMACPMVQRVVSKASIRQDLADVAWFLLRQTLRAGREISTMKKMKNLWWGNQRIGQAEFRAYCVRRKYLRNSSRVSNAGPKPASRIQWTGASGAKPKMWANGST